MHIQCDCMYWNCRSTTQTCGVSLFQRGASVLNCTYSGWFLCTNYHSINSPNSINIKVSKHKFWFSQTHVHLCVWVVIIRYFIQLGDMSMAWRTSTECLQVHKPTWINHASQSAYRCMIQPLPFYVLSTNMWEPRITCWSYIATWAGLIIWGGVT